MLIAREPITVEFYFVFLILNWSTISHTIRCKESVANNLESDKVVMALSRSDIDLF